MTHPDVAAVGTYALVTVGGDDRLVATLSGFFNLDQVAEYALKAEQAIRQLTGLHGRYRMVIDIRECPAQSQDVIAAFQAHVARVPRAQPLAILVSSALVRRQIARVINRSGVAIFDSYPDAMVWIDSDAALSAA